MNAPYPGKTYNQNPQTTFLTGQEIVPMLQSGKNVWAYSTLLTASGAGTVTQILTGSGLIGGPISSSGTITIDIGAGLAFSGNTLIATATGGGGGSGSVTQIDSGFGLAGGPITSSGQLYVVIGDGLAFSGNAIVNTSGNGVLSVFTRTGDVTAVSGDYFSAQVTESGNLYFTTGRVQTIAPNVTLTGQTYLTITGQAITVNPITLSGSNVSGNLPFINIQSASPSVLLGNPTATTGAPSQITLGAGIGFSGTTLINLSGAADGVTSITFQSGLSGGTITGTGTVGISNSAIISAMFSANAVLTAAISGNQVTYAKIQQAAPSILIGNPTASTGSPSEITLGANLSFSGTTLVAAGSTGGSSGTVTQISTGTGLTGGPVTSSGTISFATVAPSSLWANVSTATTTPVVTTLAGNLAFSGTTLTTTNLTTGTVTNVATGTGLTGGAITNTGTISFASIATKAFWANVSTATAVPVVTTLAGNLAFSGTTLTTTGLTTGTVGSIATGTGLTGGTITNTGTIAFSTIAPSSLWANVSTATNTPVVTTLGGGLGFSGTTIVNLSGAADGVISVATGTGLTGGTITNTGTISFATISPSSLWANVSTATNTPVITTLGAGLAFSGTTIINTGSGVGTVTQISTGSGLTGGPITSSGTVSVSAGTGLAFSGNVLVVSGGTISKQFTQATGSASTYALDSSAVFPYTVDAVRGLKTSTGSITLTFTISTVPISGLSGIVVTVTAQSISSLATNTVAIGNRVAAVFSTNTSASFIEFTMAGTRNG